MYTSLSVEGNGSTFLVVMFQPRHYRRLHKPRDLVSFEVILKETDLYISANSHLEEEAKKAILRYRIPLEEYIQKNPEFLTSLEPLPVDDSMPYIAKIMASASAKVGVGPMAAVAGAMAEAVGQGLLKYSPEVIVENGGDIFIKTSRPRTIAIYTGERSPFYGKLAIEINPEDTPLGICTSSGVIGHSLSFGKADSVTVLSKDTALADVAATAIGNLIKTEDDFPAGIEFAKGISGLKGVVLVKGEKMSVWGDVRLAER